LEDDRKARWRIRDVDEVLSCIPCGSEIMIFCTMSSAMPGQAIVHVNLADSGLLLCTTHSRLSGDICVVTFFIAIVGYAKCMVLMCIISELSVSLHLS
jgi:hypothetical protein